MSVAIVDSLPELGGQVAALYPEKFLYDIPSRPRVQGRELVAGLVEQLEPFDVALFLADPATGLVHQDNGLELTLASGSVLQAGVLVVAAGIGTFRPRPVEPASAFLGQGLEYLVGDLARYEGKDVVVVGGGDSACDWALALEAHASSVTLVHRRDQFRAHEYTVQRLRSSDARIRTPEVVAAVLGERRVEGVRLRHVKTGVESELPADEIIGALGFIANIAPIDTWGMETSGRRLVVDSRMQTSVERIYAVGDVSDYPGKVRLIAVGFGEAAIAVNNAAVQLNPSTSLEPGHSSDRRESPCPT